MKMNLELAGTKSEEAIAAAAAQREQLETANASLLSAQQREASLQQQTELSALELAQERERATAAAEAAELRTEQLIEELDLLKRSKASNSDDAEAAHSTIKELRMRLVSAEEECGKAKRASFPFLAGHGRMESCSATNGRTAMRLLRVDAGVQVSYSARLTNLRQATIQVLAKGRVGTRHRSESSSWKLKSSRKSVLTNLSHPLH